MRTSGFTTLAMVTLAIVMAACDAAGGFTFAPQSPTAPTTPPRVVGVAGFVMSATDSTPVNQVLLEVYEITGGGTPDRRVGSTRSAANGRYSLFFAARCDRMYGLKAAFPHAVVRCSACPVWPLPADGCAGGWAVDLWVEE